MVKFIELLKNYDSRVCNKYIVFYGRKKGLSIYKNLRKKCYVGCFFSLVLFPFLVYFGSSVLLSIVLILVLLIGFAYLPESMINNKNKVLRRSYAIDMPDFLDRTALLLDAGQNLWEAIEKAATANEDDSSLYGEIYRTIREIKDCGGTEKDPCEAFSEMAKRCASSPVSSFVSVIVQNSRKGTSELVEIIRLQATICRNDRMNAAKKLGEEATTLMLIPTTLLFIAILVMILAPAFMAIYSF